MALFERTEPFFDFGNHRLVTEKPGNPQRNPGLLFPADFRSAAGTKKSPAFGGGELPEAPEGHTKISGNHGLTEPEPYRNRTQQNKNFVAFEGDICYNMSMKVKMDSSVA